MDKNRFKNILKKYQDRESNQEEQHLVDEWYDAFETDLYESGPLSKIEKLDQKLLRNSIYKGVVNRLGGPGQKTQTLPAEQLRVGRLSKAYLAFAAGLLFFFGVSLMFWQFRTTSVNRENLESQLVEIVAPPGKLKAVTLPDSSVVWLNAGSKLTFVLPFEAGITRRVVLEDGEAFFDVKRDTLKPFIVHSSGLDTRVLGTSFVVKAYQSLDHINVSVLTGQVEVSQGNRVVLAVLAKGDKLVYDRKSNQADLQKDISENSNSWIQGVTYLNQASFEELAIVFKNAYAMELKAGHENILNQKYSIQLDRNPNMEDLIKAICAVHKNKYRKEGDTTITIFE